MPDVSRRRAFVALALAAALSACAASAPRPSFTDALDAHLAAIGARDLAGFEKTISDDDFLVIFPNGEALETRAAVVDFHKEWFADPAWRMTPEIVKIIEGDDFSTALLKYDYRDTPDGAPRAAWLNLVFKLENGEWRLVHDQNTRIAPVETGGEE